MQDILGIHWMVYKIESGVKIFFHQVADSGQVSCLPCICDTMKLIDNNALAPKILHATSLREPVISNLTNLIG